MACDRAKVASRVEFGKRADDVYGSTAGRIRRSIHNHCFCSEFPGETGSPSAIPPARSITGLDPRFEPRSDRPARFPTERSDPGQRFQAEFQHTHPSSSAPRPEQSGDIGPIRELANIWDVQGKFRGRANSPRPRRAAANVIRPSSPMLGTTAITGLTMTLTVVIAKSVPSLTL